MIAGAGECGEEGEERGGGRLIQVPLIEKILGAGGVLRGEREVLFA